MKSFKHKPLKLTEGPFKGYTVTSAPQDQLAATDEAAIQRVLDVLGYPEAYVTDWSSVSDFEVSDAELAAASAALGVPIRRDDKIVDLALRLHPQ